MSSPRFFCSFKLTEHQNIALPESLTHHAVRVLRLKNNSQITLFDGTGGEYPAHLQIDGKHASAQLGAHDPIERELPGRITLVQGLASGDKMDWIIEKAVELGVHTIVPISARRSVLQLSGARLEKRLEHWRKIIQAACEQCGRNRQPSLEAPQTLAECMQSSHRTGMTLLCHPEANQELAQVLRDQKNESLVLMVGPEGGWAPEELEIALAGGATRIMFGTRVLRTETAGLALVAATSALLGWR